MADLNEINVHYMDRKTGVIVSLSMTTDQLEQGRDALRSYTKRDRDAFSSVAEVLLLDTMFYLVNGNTWRRNKALYEAKYQLKQCVICNDGLYAELQMGLFSKTIFLYGDSSDNSLSALRSEPLPDVRSRYFFMASYGGFGRLLHEMNRSYEKMMSSGELLRIA